MADKEESSMDTPGSRSSNLSDSWSVVNTDGDILKDEDSCSTASSVEVVDEEEEEEENGSLYSSQHTSLGTTPTGPLFVLRLSSHDVSDTDDDQAPSGVTDGLTDSQSFDILKDHTKDTVEEGAQPEDVQIGTQVQSGDSSCKEDLNSESNKQQAGHSSPDVEEHVQKFVEALGEVERNLQTKPNGGTNIVSENTEKPLEMLKVRREVPVPECTQNITAHSTNESQNVSSTESARVMIETIGTNPTLVTDDTDTSLGSSYSLLDTDKETSHIIKDSPDSSDTTIMNQSMERTETHRNQQLIVNTERGEPPADIVGHEAENEAGNQRDTHRPTVGRMMKLLYRFLKEIYVRLRQRFATNGVMTLLCVVVVICNVTATYYSYAYLSTKYGPFHNGGYHLTQTELKNCRLSEETLRLEYQTLKTEHENLKLGLGQTDKGCMSSLKEAIKIIRRWTYTSPDNYATEVHKYLTEVTDFCGVGKDKGNCDAGNKEHLQTLESKIKTLTFLLERVIIENRDLHNDLQASQLETAKLKASLEEEEFKWSQSKKQQEQTAWTGGDEDATGTNKEKTEEDLVFDKCLNVMMEFYQHKLSENYHWFEMESGTMRQYLSGYLFDIIPENMWSFFQRMKNGGNPPNQEGNQDEQETSQSAGSQGNNNGGRETSQEKTKDTDYTKNFEDSSDGEERNEPNDEESWSRYTGSGSSQWADSVLEMMNKTRSQLQDTWQQVKNVSEQMWERHEPAITKLQNTFIRKLQHLSDKFQQKLAKKADKWFNRRGKRKRGEHSQSANTKEEKMAKTKRREEKPDETQGNRPTKKQYICSSDIIQVQESIINLNAKKFKKSDINGDSRRILKKLKQINRQEEIPATSLVKTWLNCQIDWWTFNIPKPFELPQYLVTEKCFDSVECWQLKVSEGQHGIGHMECRRLKRANGNVIDKVCYVDTEEDTVNGNYQTETEDIHTKSTGNLNKHQDSVKDNPQYTDKHSDNDDDIYDDDVIDDGGVEDSDEEIENWYTRRAEEREYHHGEPDDWYFRRQKKTIMHKHAP